MRLEIAEATVSHDEGAGFWQGTVRLAGAADYARLQRYSPITINILGDDYAMVVKSLNRTKSNRGIDQVFDVACSSRLWLTLGEEAAPITRTWDQVSARAVVEELAGEAVAWEIIDWLIPAGRLARVNARPIDIINQVVKAAGALVESEKDGSLRVRYQYPVSIPSVAGAALDHALDDAAVVALSEKQESKTIFNRLVLTDRTSQKGYLSAELDPAQTQPVLGGEQQKFLVFHSSDIEINRVLLSDGTLLDLGEISVDTEEDVVFANTDSAPVSRVVSGGFSYTWYGDGLGAISVASDERTLTVPAAGVGVAHVKYTSTARSYAVLAPTTSGGKSQFPIIAYVIGALRADEVISAGQLRIAVQRGAGDVTGDDVIEALAGNENVLLNRGRNEIDAAAAKGLVTLDLAYDGTLRNGNLLGLDDTQIGQAWRSKIASVEHRIEKPKGVLTVTSRVNVERFLP